MSLFFPHEFDQISAIIGSELSNNLLVFSNEVSNLQCELSIIKNDILSVIDNINTSSFIPISNILPNTSLSNSNNLSNHLLDFNFHKQYYMDVFDQLNQFNVELNNIQKLIYDNIFDINNNELNISSNNISCELNKTIIKDKLKPQFMNNTSNINTSINMSTLIEILNQNIDNCRGEFATIDDIPSDGSEYNEDLNGNRYPHKYDYIIIDNVFDEHKNNLGKWKFIYKYNKWIDSTGWIKLYQISPVTIKTQKLECDNLGVVTGTTLCEININSKSTILYSNIENKNTSKYDGYKQIFSFSPYIDPANLEKFYFYYGIAPNLSFIMVSDNTGGSFKIRGEPSTYEYSIKSSGWYKVLVENIPFTDIDKMFLYPCSGKTLIISDILVNNIRVDTICTSIFSEAQPDTGAYKYVEQIDKELPIYIEWIRYIPNANKSLLDYSDEYNRQRKQTLDNIEPNASIGRINDKLFLTANKFLSEIRGQNDSPFILSSLKYDKVQYDNFGTTTYSKLLYLHSGDTLTVGITDEIFNKIKTFCRCPFDGLNEEGKIYANHLRYTMAKFKYSLFKID